MTGSDAPDDPTREPQQPFEDSHEPSLDQAPSPDDVDTDPGRLVLGQHATITDALLQPAERTRLGLPMSEDQPMEIILELNVDHRGGVAEAQREFLALWVRIMVREAPERIGSVYFAARLSLRELRRLIAVDKERDFPDRSIRKAWPDFPVTPLIYRSVATVKADAARRAFAADGSGITWAVIDSGIDGSHQHFRRWGNLSGPSADLHYDFTQTPRQPEGVPTALIDEFGHGTHVAGILAGGLFERVPRGMELLIVEHSSDETSDGGVTLERMTMTRPGLLAGVAPACQFVSLKVLDDNGNGSISNVIRALKYINEDVNGYGRKLRIHGVNISLGYEFYAKWAACGQSPVCIEVDRLVKSGVVVVVASGNTGYGMLSASTRSTHGGLEMTINDPGNSRLAITVGATHRDAPYTYGVSCFSSKGPTADGRLKPDLVAPGEAITSCAAGRALREALHPGQASDRTITYTDSSGTSLAASHVSGAIAAFLSIRQEFIGQPEEVKSIFLKTATSLGRERNFEGNGLVDIMRAIQSI